MTIYRTELQQLDTKLFYLKNNNKLLYSLAFCVLA